MPKPPGKRTAPPAKTGPQPGDLLRANATDHVCILLDEPITELRLPAQFLTDLGQALPGLTLKSIMEDVLCSAISREHAHRRIHSQPRRRSEGPPRSTEGRAYAFDTHTSFTILTVLLLRMPGQIREAGRGNLGDVKLRAMTQAERQAVLRLVYSYGVGCAAGACCDLCPDPIRLQEAA